MDHDLTFDPVSQLQRDNDPDALENFRTPSFDLDCVYGRGPDDQPYLYAGDAATLIVASDKPWPGENDLPRNSDGTAIIGDPRNDANIIVAQLHLSVMRYHNKVVQTLKDRGVNDALVFDAARQIVKWHYQWIVLNEYLPLVAGEENVGAVLQLKGVAPTDAQLRHSVELKSSPRRVYFNWKNDRFMPIEFSGAVFRFAHSMVRNDYQLNPSLHQPVMIFDELQTDDTTALDLRGRRLTRPEGMMIDWELFFSRHLSSKIVQLARPIDPLIVQPLTRLPKRITKNETELGPSLPALNLLRGKSLGLPSGQSVADHLHVPEEFILGRGIPFTISQEGLEGDINNIAGKKVSVQDLENYFREDTPLWYYVLKEAWAIHKGERLGPVGGRILSEVFNGLLLADKTSFLNLSPRWAPTLGEHGCREPGQFRMKDLLDYVWSP